MAFKNAFKILIEKFGLVWMLLLYVFVLAVILVSVSMAFMIPIYRAFLNAGIMEQFTILFESVTNGESLNRWFEIIRGIGDSVSQLLKENFSLRLNSTLWLTLVVVVAYRFLLGLYELPLISVLDGAMSSNARIGFGGQFIAKLGKSSCFTLVKMMYTVLFDAATMGIMYGLFKLLDVAAVSMFAPFIIMLAFILLTALRYTLIAMWSPRIVTDNGKIFASFGFSVKQAGKNLGSMYAYFLVSWVLIIAFNIFVGLFTIGVGLLISIPTSMLLISVLNMTLYYGKNGKRYYVDGAVVTPPTSCDVESEENK